jgi:NAD(P)-dependent dehydrogenase (short-subunit alcohol dehydrogenase family)
MVLDGQVIAVTGAAHGMGRAYAAAVVGHGGRVGAIDINKEGLQVLASELGDACIPIVCDLVRGGDHAVRELIDRAGTIDGLINNAGVFHWQPFVEHSMDSFDLIMGVNLRGPFLTCQAAVKYWLANGRTGQIVNVSSRGGAFANSPRMAAYSASKAAILGMTLNIAEELASTGIVVNAVCPRARTGMGSRLSEEELAAQDDIEQGHPTQMVAPVLYLASPQASWINGQVFVLDTGRLQLLHGWHSVSGLDKGSRWELEEMDRAFKRVHGTTTNMADDAINPYHSIAGIAARGRTEWT